MEVISIAAHKERKREEWKREVLSFIERELNKIDPSNFDYVGQQIKDHTGFLAYTYAEPGAAKRQRERLRQEYPDLFKGGTP